MDPLLFMVHRIPYPPNKGDKIRSFNILRWLSQRYEVHLGCFVDDENDQQYVSKLSEYCCSYKVVKLKPTLAKALSLRAFVTGDPITLPYYSSPELMEWVNEAVEKHQIKQSLAFSSSMAQYVMDDRFDQMNRVIDLVDVDSDKWRQYAEKSSFPMSWVYRREHQKLEVYERKIASNLDAIALVSPEEVILFKTLLPDALQGKVVAVSNGVDSDFFDNKVPIEPIELPELVLSFTGAMDYWANVEAVTWFCDEVWSSVLNYFPNAYFYIVGTSPSSDVQALQNQKNVVVTGRVKDVRPYINASTVVVAPLRIARGIQNKVLEALAMEKVVIGTSMAFEGIAHQHKTLGVVIADDKDNFIESVVNQIKLALDDYGNNIKPENRTFVTEYYNWDAKLQRLTGLLR